MVGGEVAVGYDDKGNQIVIGSQSDISRGYLPPSPSGHRIYYGSERAYSRGRSYKKTKPKIQITPPKITPPQPFTQKKIGGEVAVGYDAEGKRVVIGKIADIRRGRLPPKTYEAMRTELEASQLKRTKAQIEREGYNIIERAKQRFSAEKLKKDIKTHGKALGLFKHYVLSPLAFPVEEAERLSEATFLYGFSDISRPSVATPEEISQAMKPMPLEYTPMGMGLGVMRRYVTLEEIRRKGEVAFKQQQAETEYLNKQITRSQLAEQKNFGNRIMTAQYGESFTQWNKEQTAELETLGKSPTEEGYEAYSKKYGEYAQGFQKREAKYGQLYGDYKKNVESADEQLKNAMKFADIEMKTKTEKGKEMIEFSSKNLALDITPSGIKQYKAGGKYKYELFATQLGGRTAEAFSLGILLSGTGTSKVITDLLRIQKWSKTAKVIVGVGIPAVATGVSGYAGAKAGKPYGLERQMALLMGGATLSSFAGFVAGDIYGSKLYLQSQEAKLNKEAMQLTKQWSKRTGKIYALEGKESKITIARQKSVVETKLPSVKGKIRTYGELVSVRSGGKKVTGFAKGGAVSYYDLEGKPIKAKDLIISKIEMLEGKNSKTAYKVLSAKLGKNIKQGYLDTFYTKSQLAKKPKIVSLEEGKKLYKFEFATGTKLAKSEIISRGEFKKSLFSKAEIKEFMGTGKSVTLKQWITAKPYEISATKQYSLLYKPITRGQLTATKFEAVGKTKGMGTDLIKKMLKMAIEEQLKLERQMKLKSYLRGMIQVQKKGSLMMPTITRPTTKAVPIKTFMPYSQASFVQQEEALMNAHVKSTDLIIHKILGGKTRSILESSVLAGLIVSPKVLLEQRKIMLTRAIQPTKLTQVARSTLLQQTKIAQAQITKMQMKQIQIQKIIQQTIIRPIEIPIIPKIPFIPILFPQQTYEGGQARKGFRTSISKRLLAYNPDITSRLLLIKAKKDQDKIINKFYSGLELRPIV